MNFAGSFYRGCHKLDKVFSSWRDSSAKQAYINMFSPTKWEDMSDVRKRMHTCKLCKFCANFHTTVHAKFPSNKNNLVSALKNKPLFNIHSKAKSLTTVKTAKPTKSDLKGVGEEIFKTFDVRSMQRKSWTLLYRCTIDGPSNHEWPSKTTRSCRNKEEEKR